MPQYMLLRDYETHKISIPAGSVSTGRVFGEFVFGTDENDIRISQEEIQENKEWFKLVNEVVVEIHSTDDGLVHITLTNLREDINNLKVWLTRVLND